MRLSISQRMPHGLLRAVSRIQSLLVTGGGKIRRQKGRNFIACCHSTRKEET